LPQCKKAKSSRGAIKDSCPLKSSEAIKVGALVGMTKKAKNESNAANAAKNL